MKEPKHKPGDILWMVISDGDGDSPSFVVRVIVEKVVKVFHRQTIDDPKQEPKFNFQVTLRIEDRPGIAFERDESYPYLFKSRDQAFQKLIDELVERHEEVEAEIAEAQERSETILAALSDAVEQRTQTKKGTP